MEPLKESFIRKDGTIYKKNDNFSKVIQGTLFGTNFFERDP